MDTGIANNDFIPEWFKLLDHTADTGIIVYASTIEQLFERAAWAMFYVICDVTSVQNKISREIRVESDDLETLMLRWLSELNYLHSVKHELYCSFDIIKYENGSIEAKIGGEKIDLSRHQLKLEIKAVTYHCLKIEKEVKRSMSDSWRCQVLFDV